jgi:hypothetical protein
MSLLHYDVRATPSCHAKAGFLHDSTIGFNQNIGFRFGTSYPFFLHDLGSGATLPILEIPLIVQDNSLFNEHISNSNKENDYAHLHDLIRAVRDVGGVLTLLWHPDAPHIDPERWKLYKNLLERFKEMRAWITCVREVGQVWRNATKESDKLF